MNFEDLDQTLREKLLRLQTKNGNASDYVALIHQNGTVQPAFFDLRNDAQVEYLKSEYIREWQPEVHAEKQRKQSEIWEKQKFDAAEKVKAEEWGDPVFYNDEYYHSVEDFIDWWVDNCEEFDETGLTYEEIQAEALKHLPKFVYASKPIKVINVSVGMVAEEMFRYFECCEDFDPDLQGKEELRAALDKFYELNKDQGWCEADYKKIILL